MWCNSITQTNVYAVFSFPYRISCLQMHVERKYNLVFLGVPFITVLYAFYTSYVELQYNLPSSGKYQIYAKVPNLYMGEGQRWRLILDCQLLNTEQAYHADLFCAEYLSHNSFHILPCFFKLLSLCQLEVSSRVSIIHSHLVSSVSLSYALVAFRH